MRMKGKIVTVIKNINSVVYLYHLLTLPSVSLSFLIY